MIEDLTEQFNHRSDFNLLSTRSLGDSLVDSKCPKKTTPSSTVIDVCLTQTHTRVNTAAKLKQETLYLILFA